MALKIYDTLAPQGDYPAVSGQHVSVTTSVNASTDATANDGNLLRKSYHLGGPISLGGAGSYRINRLAVRATAGTTVRFALYDVGDGQLNYLAVLGEAVADSAQVAALSFASGLTVARDNTIILALAQETAIHCLQVEEGLSVSGGVQFDDGDYFDNEAGTQIPWYDSGVIMSSAFARDIDFLTEQTLEEYITTTAGRLQAVEAQPAGGGSSEIPAFDLTAMGLSAVPIAGSTTVLEGDMSEICAALEKGPVKFSFTVGDEDNDSFEITVVMASIQTDGMYYCTYTTDLYGGPVYISVVVAADLVGALVTPYTTYIDAYMEEALGGDY